MLSGSLIDSLNLKARDFAVRWKDLIRKVPHLKHYNKMTDEELIESDLRFYTVLARALDRGIDRSIVGNFFVGLGKERMKQGFPISEVIYAVNLIQHVIIEYMMTDFAPENSMRMYQAMGALTRVAEFFLSGSFYLTKGFLEETYTHMAHHDKVSEELLKKYFKDDFFFKKNNED